MRFSRDFAFLFLDLPASFRSSASLFFSSSKSGFAVPSFSSLNLRTYSKISMASSTLYSFPKWDSDIYYKASIIPLSDAPKHQFVYTYNKQGQHKVWSTKQHIHMWSKNCQNSFYLLHQTVSKVQRDTLDLCIWENTNLIIKYVNTLEILHQANKSASGLQNLY